MEETSTGVDRTEELTPALPAVVAAGETTKLLARTATRDPLVRRAIDEIKQEPRPKPAPKGMEGDYTLQVISYDRKEPAEEFAQGLRARGHEAFVVEAEIPERGRFYRVRIGPFERRHRAEAYRRKFEEQERMHTFVVRRPKEQHSEG